MMDMEWYVVLLSLKKWHRYALSLLIMGIISLFWLLLLYLPLHRQLIDVTVQVEQFKKDIALCVDSQQWCNDFAQEVDQLQADYTVCLKTEKREFLAHIINLFEAHAIQLISIKRGEKKEKNGLYNLFIHVQARGSLHAIDAFFKQLQQEQLCVQSSQLDMQYEHNGEYMFQMTLKILLVEKVMQKENPSTLEKS